MTVFQKIKNYLSTKDIHPIWSDRDVMLWVDWRDLDSRIVNYFSVYVGEDNLHGIEKEDYNVDIVYKGKTYSIPYPNNYADRDTTLTYLNEVINDEFEIRFVKETDGSDTLAFSILRNQEWQSLDNEYGKEIVDKYYQKLKRGEPVFGE